MKNQITAIAAVFSLACSVGFAQDEVIDHLRVVKRIEQGSLTTTERDALTGLPSGSMTIIYNSTTSQREVTIDGGTSWAAAGGSAGSTILNKSDATTSPAVGDDSADGYEVFSLWNDTVGKDIWICLDATAGAAVWKDITEPEGAGGGGGGGLDNVIEDITPQLGGDLDANAFSLLFDTGTGINDASDNELLTFTTTASAVNEFTFANAATGSGPSIAATGDDTNIDFLLSGKGTGVVKANGSQVITMGASEFSTLTEDASPASGDLFLVEKASDGSKVKVEWGTLPSGGGGGSGVGVLYFIPDATGRYDGSGDLTSSVLYRFRDEYEGEGNNIGSVSGATSGADFDSLSTLEDEIESEIDAGTVTASWDDGADLLTLEFSVVPRIGGKALLSIQNITESESGNLGGGTRNYEGVNAGTGSELYKGNTIAGMIFRSLLSADSSITLTENANDITMTFVPSSVKLDDLGAADDNTDLDVSTTAHGLAPKLPNDATKYLDGTGNYTVPGGGGGGASAAGDMKGASATTEISTPQDLTTTYADVTGGSITYTPEWDDSSIVFEFNCQVTRGDADGIAHFKFLVAGVEQASQRRVLRINSTDTPFHYMGRYTNASTTAKVFKLQARDFSATLETSLHGTFHMDGATSSVDVDPVVKITETKN